MGLDMFAFTVTKAPDAPTDFTTKEGEVTLLYYWRKHPNLHGWMESLYRVKGGAADTFNCRPVVLDLNDLDHLEEDVRNRRLPLSSGFFFGQSDGSEADGDLEFIEKARKAIEAGLTVYYDSWW